MPNRAKVGEMQAELSFKSRQRETAETTHARLLKEHAKRTSELNKIDTLDSKISVELSSLNSKIQRYHVRVSFCCCLVATTTRLEDSPTTRSRLLFVCVCITA